MQINDESSKAPKVVLFLGAGFQQLAPIHYARQAGYRVVTCDYCPSNPGHQLADRSYDVSTTDLHGVLQIAIKESVDAIVAYASDVAAPTAAWVAQRMGLRGNPYEAVLTLTNKARFRKFQKERGHFAPAFLIYTAERLVGGVAMKEEVTNRLGLPVVVKPVDASGSRGVSKIHDAEKLVSALSLASKHSRCGDVIVEQLIPQAGYQICGEGFLQDGKIIFCVFADEHFAPGIVPPIGESFPCTVSKEKVTLGVDALQSIFSDLEMRDGPFNFDLLYVASGDVFVIEIGPRNGGNRMPEAILHAYGTDTIMATVESALGRTVALPKQWVRHCATYSIHAKHNGVFRSLEYKGGIEERIISEQMFVGVGDAIERFENGSQMLGCLILSFDSQEQMISTMARTDDMIHVQVDDADRPQRCNDSLKC